MILPRLPGPTCHRNRNVVVAACLCPSESVRVGGGGRGAFADTMNPVHSEPFVKSQVHEDKRTPRSTLQLMHKKNESLAAFRVSVLFPGRTKKIVNRCTGCGSDGLRRRFTYPGTMRQHKDPGEAQVCLSLLRLTLITSHPPAFVSACKALYSRESARSFIVAGGKRALVSEPSELRRLRFNPFLHGRSGFFVIAQSLTELSGLSGEQEKGSRSSSQSLSLLVEWT